MPRRQLAIIARRAVLRFTAASNSIIMGKCVERGGHSNQIAWLQGQGSRREFSASNSPSDINLVDSELSNDTQIAETKVATIISSKSHANSTDKDKVERNMDPELPLDVKSLIIFEDNHLIVMNKTPCLLTQGDSTGNTNLLDKTKAYLIWRDHKPGDAYLGT